jgi:uncharacterized membrane protein YhhN
VKTIKKVVIVVFLIFSAIEIYAAFTNQSSIKFISTPTLMPLLAIFYLLCTRKKNWLVIAALVLSLIGDVLNQWQSNEDIFMIETAAFLLALVCYIIVLNQPISHLRKVPPAIYSLSVIYIVYGIIIYLMLRPYLGEMELPCIIYLAIVLLMSFSALTRIGQFKGRSLWLPLIGSLFFIASDTLLAVNAFKYNGEMRYGDFLTTISYIPAQVFIVLGLVPAEERII